MYSECLKNCENTKIVQRKVFDVKMLKKII